MSDYTIDLHAGNAAPAQVALIGGKGAGLRSLTAAGFQVPRGFVITTNAYREVVDAAGLTGMDPERLRAEILRIAIPPEIADEILAGHAALAAESVAVRSSATAEDLAGASFAGQYDSYLSIPDGEGVLDAVRRCWASLWTPRAVDYRAQNHPADDQLAMAVVVQTMVPAESAGVLFTADPVSGRRDRMVLESVAGLGEALVSGTATGEHLSIDKTTLSITGQGGPGAAVVRELADLGVRAEQAFGGAQDLEWAYADGRCWLLQARPLTALPDEPPADARRGSPLRRLHRGRKSDQQPKPSPFAITADHLPQPPYPMDLALFVRPALKASLDAARSAGLRLPPLDEVLVEIDDGVVQIRPPRFRLGRHAVRGLPTAVPRLVRLLRTSTADWRARSDEIFMPLARRRDGDDLTGLTDQQLLDQVNELFATAGRLAPSRFGAIPAGVAADLLVGLLLRPMVGSARAEVLHVDLMADIDCVTTRANAELDRLAENVREDPQLRAAYEQSEPAHVAQRLAAFASGQLLLERLDAYLADYGYRELAILTVGQPSLRERPEVVHGLIKGLIGLEGAASTDRDGRAHRAQAELSARTGPAATILRPALRKAVEVARDGVAFREDSDYRLAMVPAIARRLLLELGGRMVRRGAFDDPSDIAFLTPAELGLPPDQVRRLVERRSRARSAALDGYSIIPVELLGGADKGLVSGTPASPGSYVGTVRVVHDESEFATLQAGEVLVCPYTNPVWTPLFALAGAVVVDSGGAASHAAIVAREYGIPAVMGTGNATTRLTDGQRVLVDADHGTVTAVAPATANREPAATSGRA
ncbi:MAG TPA: PEP/pyruvate-binding domain-containing protein [Microlunatus sp.]